VKLVFADTLYWGAILHPQDQYRGEAIRARKALGDFRLVTTDEVLTELLDGLAHRGKALRNSGEILTNDHHFVQEGLKVLLRRKPPHAHK